MHKHVWSREVMIGPDENDDSKLKTIWPDQMLKGMCIMPKNHTKRRSLHSDKRRQGTTSN